MRVARRRACRQRETNTECCGEAMERKVLTGALRPGSDCLPIEQLGRYADGALSRDERDAAASHVDTCANCQAELALLHAFTTGLVRDDERAIVRSGVDALRRRESEIFGAQPHGSSNRLRSSPFGTRRAMLSIAAALLAVVSAYYLLIPRPPALPGETGSASDVTRALTVPVQGPSGDQATAPERFEWRAVSGAVRYHVQLLEVGRHELWSTDAIGTAVELPANARAQLVPGKTLLWQVTAIGPSNAPIAESDTQRFRVMRP